MSNLSCIVLAAGEGKRMGTSLPKVLCEILYEPMLSWVLDSVCKCNIDKTCVVAGYKYDLVINFLSELKYRCEVSIQKEQKGTAHAVLCAYDFLERYKNNDVLIINGDTPFMDENTIMEAYKFHKKSSNDVTIITSKFEKPKGYGRILRDDKRNVLSIVEEKDTDEFQKNINEINSGTYWFRTKSLLKYLKLIDQSQSGEYYLTSIVKLFISDDLKVETYESENPLTILGANTPEQLEFLNSIAKADTLDKFKKQGIHIPYDDKVIIGKNVEIGEGTMILSDVTIINNAKIGKNCVIGPGTNIIGGTIDDNTNVIFRNLIFDQYKNSVNIKNNEKNI